jgi:predicted enzyme related to lactoylglutathione lyase
LIYAENVERVATFYQQLLPMRRLFADAGHVVLESPDFQLLIQAAPARDDGVAAARASAPRDRAAIKLFFTVENLADATTTARALGGDVFATAYAGPGFTVRNGRDPEGNVFHLREPAP